MGFGHWLKGAITPPRAIRNAIPAANPFGIFGGGGGGGSQIHNPADPQMQGIINQGQQAGVFNPLGSPALLNSIRQNYIGNQGAMDRRSGLNAEMYGNGDPSLSAYAHLQSGLQGSHDLSQGMYGAQLQSMLQNQRFIQNMMPGYYGAQNQLALGQAGANSQNQAMYGNILGSMMPYLMMGMG